MKREAETMVRLLAVVALHVRIQLIRGRSISQLPKARSDRQHTDLVQLSLLPRNTNRLLVRQKLINASGQSKERVVQVRLPAFERLKKFRWDDRAFLQSRLEFGNEASSMLLQAEKVVVDHMQVGCGEHDALKGIPTSM